MKTVYIVLEGGIIQEARCEDSDVELVILDRDTTDLKMLEEIDVRISEIAGLPEIELY